MVFNTLGEVFKKLKKARYGTIYMYHYRSKDQTYHMHVATHLERMRLYRKWVQLKKRKTTHTASLKQAFNRVVVAYDIDDDIFIDRSIL